MKRSTFSATPLLALAILTIASCGQQDTSKTTETTTADTTSQNTTPVTTTPPSTIINTPQNMMVVTHRIGDFNKWKTSYDAHDSMRLANGIHTYVIGRGVKDSNTVLVALKIDDVDKAKAFAKNPSLRQAMQKGGVVGAPNISFTTMTYQDTATINADIRSRTRFTVKDWNQWQRSFDSSRQMRKDNGIVDRAYGHDTDNDHNVTIVVALTDTARAYSYWKSDALKKARAASGVTSEPQRFLYHVVQRQ